MSGTLNPTKFMIEPFFLAYILLFMQFYSTVFKCIRVNIPSCFPF